MKKKNFYIITKTPLRVSFVGGGTDLPFFYKKKYGLVVSTTINKFVYVSVKSHDRLFKENYRLNYSSTEHIKGGMNKIKNKIVKACLKYMNIHIPLNINISSKNLHFPHLRLFQLMLLLKSNLYINYQFFY